MCNCQRDPSKDPATENEKVNNLREEIIKRLEQTVESDQFLREEPMKKHITFRVGGPAACFLTPSTKEQIEEMFEYLICAVCPLKGEYEPGRPEWGFLFPAFTEQCADLNHVQFYQADTQKTQTAFLKRLLGV